MQRVFWILALFSVLLLPAMYFLLPDQVATHFDIAGKPNGWSSKNNFIVTWGEVNIVAVIFPYFIKFLIKNCPSELINIPNKSYWMQKDNLPLLYKKIDSTCWEIGCFMLLMLIGVSIEILRSNRMVPLQNGQGWWFPVATLIASAFLIIKIMWDYRIPKDKNMETPNNF